MKKLFNLFALGLLSFAFVSCENGKTSFSSQSDLNGLWIRVDKELYGEFSFEMQDDKLIYRDHKGYIDYQNYFIYEGSWPDGRTFKYEFDEKEQAIYISGMQAGIITRVDKDKALFEDRTGFLRSSTLQRVKGIKSESELENEYPDTYNPNSPVTTNATNGALPGKFSVSATTQVQFSQGNLQYQASTKTWRFAGQQYYYVGSENENISDSNTGWIDLFGWGTGNNPTQTSTEYSDYSTFTDWGANKIFNGGNQANQWRTLTNDEWKYLFNERAHASSKKGQATVDGVHGYIFLPDSWTLPSGLSFTSSPNNWRMNVYTTSDWSKMEKAGAVFLPAAGMRSGTGVGSVGSYGCFWSSTQLDENYVYDFLFSDYLVSTNYFDKRVCGRSVRLVR